ncbi:MAG: GerMN domain-containing protein [Caldisericaceae bacterium]|nr:GerMN domain-containing protein [Caldisericaceae bacterium]RLD19537.1 MAG: hypothetical protein DRI33_02895 [Caldisericota bacterium]
MKKIVVLIFSVFILLLMLQGCKTEQKNLILNNASVNEDGTVHVEGKAIAFEGTVNIEVTDNESNICFAGFTTTDAKEPSDYGTFKKDIVLTLFPQSDQITLKCFLISAKDGTTTEKEEKTLSYKVEYQLINIYLPNSVKNPEMIDCEKVYPLERRIKKESKNPAIDALRFLINGPTEKEKELGYLDSMIPQSTSVNFVKTEGESVVVDFGKEFLNITGGSCKVQAIRAEIEQTVKQFYPDYNIIISANGNREEVLQP